MIKPNGFVDKILDTDMAGKVCSALGIEVRQYKILLHLFDTLSNRLELMNTTAGLNGISLWYLFLSILFCLIALANPPLQTYLLIFVVVTMVFLLMTIVQEAAHSLLDPDEATILAHQPIRGATYVAAKLTHLLTIVAVVVPCLNLFPALAGFFLTQSRWYYPATHLVAVYLAGLFVAFFVCGTYGWLFRLVTPARLKNTVLLLQALLPFVFMALFQVMKIFIEAERIAPILTKIFSASWMPWQWFVALGLLGHVKYEGWMVWEALTGCLLTVFLIIFGLRAFRADYLIKASSIIQGRPAPVVSSYRISWLARLVRRITGDPSGYGAFKFLGIMCRRDWNFRRLVLMYGLFYFIGGLGAAIAGVRTSPFGSAGESVPTFSPVHLFPHALGFVLVLCCSVISYTSDPGGAAVFISNPVRNYRVFVKGLYLSPWIYIIVLPHLCLIGPWAWFWGVSHAALFFVYSIFVSTFYLALAFFFVEGFPFVNAFKKSRSNEIGAPLLGSMVLIALLTGIQWFLFRSMPFAVGATGAAAVMAVIALPISMRRMEEKARKNLQLLNLSPQNIFKEPD
jgi:hypothetical protein